MDWSQASWFECSVFGLGILSLCIMTAALAWVLFYCFHDFAKRKLARFKRIKKTTRALRCEICVYNVYDRNIRRCKRYGQSISGAPVVIPGCSWGVEKKGDA